MYMNNSRNIATQRTFHQIRALEKSNLKARTQRPIGEGSVGGGRGDNDLRSPRPFAAVTMRRQDMIYYDKEAKFLSFQIRIGPPSLGTQARGAEHQQNPECDRAVPCPSVPKDKRPAVGPVAPLYIHS